MKLISVIRNNSFSRHQRVYALDNPQIGLYGFIAIHHLVNGKSVGGTRMYNYSSDKEALHDALILSKTMTYKCVVAGVKYGGGKGVINVRGKFDRKKVLAEYAKAVSSLKGAFYTGEDVGISKSDVQHMLNISPFFIGKEGQAGDPSPYAALSTFRALEASVMHRYHTRKFKGLKVAIKGVGKVGSSLLRMLIKEGCLISISDVDAKVVSNIVNEFPQVTKVPPSRIHSLNVDIFSPCALGNDINKGNINEIKAKIICGAANNQLENEALANVLMKKRITFVPDYLANAGGLIDVVDELEPNGFSKKRVLSRVNRLSLKVRKVLETADQLDISPLAVTTKMVEDHLNEF
jgi:leucine dehydrogenase